MANKVHEAAGREILQAVDVNPINRQLKRDRSQAGDQTAETGSQNWASPVVKSMKTRRECFHRAIALLSLVDGNELFPDRFADVFAKRTVETIIFELFEHVRAPAGTARDGKHRREKIGWNS